MSAVPVEKKPTNGLTNEIINKIADLVKTRFYYFPDFIFAGTDYHLTSVEGRMNIYKHIQDNLGEIPFSVVDIDLLKTPGPNNYLSANEIYNVAGHIDMKALLTNGSVARPDPSMRSVVTGHNVKATGLCQLYFAAMTTRLVAFGWNAVSEATVAAVRLVHNGQSTIIAAPENQVCMKDDLAVGKLSKKAIALVVRKALLENYSEEQLLDAMIELHNSKAPFTAFLRKNSNVVSGLWGKDTDSWTEAVAQIKAEAQRRLDNAQRLAGGARSSAAEETRIEQLQAIVGYKGGLYSATIATI